MATVLGQLPEHVHVDPLQRERSASVARQQIVELKLSRGSAGRITRLAMGPAYGVNRVLIGKA